MEFDISRKEGRPDFSGACLYGMYRLGNYVDVGGVAFKPA
jgi:hypothetical protein